MGAIEEIKDLLNSGGFTVSAALPISRPELEYSHSNMSVDRGIYGSPESERPIFLDVAPGMTVIVQHNVQIGEKGYKDRWMGKLIHCGGAARDPKIHNLLQIADVDSGEIRWVNSDLVTHILPLS